MFSNVSSQVEDLANRPFDLLDYLGDTPDLLDEYKRDFYLPKIHSERALEHLNALLVAHPNSRKRVLVYRSELYQHQDNFEAARQDAQDVLSMDPQHKKALKFLHAIYTEQDKHDEAISVFAGLFGDEEQFNFEALYYQSKHYHTKGLLDEARLGLDRICHANHETFSPLHFDARYLRAQIYYEQKNFDDACSDLGLVIDGAERYSNRDTQMACLYFRSQINLEQGLLSKSREDLDRIISINPNHLEAFMRRSRVYKLEKEEGKAVLDEYAACQAVSSGEASWGAPPSLRFFAKMAFFKSEAHYYASGIAFRKPELPGVLKDTGVNAENLHVMREQLNGCRIHAPSIFTQLDRIQMENDFESRGKRRRVEKSSAVGESCDATTSKGSSL